MLLTFKIKLPPATLASAFLACALASQAASPLPGANLLTDPNFNGQPSTFQITDGPFAPGWTYSAGYDFFSGSSDLVSQSIPTSDLYYYDIKFSLDTTPQESGVDFALFWDHTPVTLMILPPSDQWANFSFQVTADGSSSDVGLVGNSAFWSSLDNLDVYWTGGIDPPPSVADGPIGFAWEAALLLGLCALAGFYRRHELSLSPQKAG